MKKLLNFKRARSIINGFRKANVLIVGDLIMDHFIWGKVTRISPEAPVPVVNVTKETLLLGGSANVVNNVHSLGGKSYVTGVIGRDSDGKTLLEMFKKKGISTDGILVVGKRPTTIKTRVIAHHQQVVRFDREQNNPLSSDIASRIIGYAEDVIKRVDVVVISDYAKGLITEALMNAVREIADSSEKPVVVDPKVEHFDYYRGVTLITPNNIEAGHASSIEIIDDETLKRAGRAIMKRLGCKALLITRGEFGMSLFEDSGETHILTVAREVFDVSGAGDTVIATMAMALSAGANLREASALSNLSAGLVVEKIGTATVTPKELEKAAERLL